MKSALEQQLYGLLAEFSTAQDLLDAVLKVQAEGYSEIDAYTPLPIEEISHAISPKRSRLPVLVLLGGCVGGVSGYLLQYWTMAVDYPLNVGGRPLNSWPMFIPITFEMTILCAVLSAVLGMFVLNKLPMPYHPVFNVPRFAAASRDGYFLSIQTADPKFDLGRTRAFLKDLKPVEIFDVAP